MKDEDKTKEQLMNELVELRQEIRELRSSEAKLKWMEVQLRESEERYRTAIEHSNDGVAIVQGDRHLYVNQRFVQMFGYDRPEEIIGQPISLMVHPDERERVNEFNRRRQMGETVPSRYEFKGVRKDAGTIFIEVSATRTTYLGKAVSLAYLRDVTERKRAEDELRKTNAFLKNILDSSSSISILSTDLDQNVLYWNKGAENIFGYKAEEIIGRHKIGILYPDDDEGTKKTVEKARSFITEKKEGMSCELREMTKDGRKRWIHLTLTPRFDEDGRVEGILGIGEDITERKAFEQRALQTERLASIGQALSFVTHEVKTPLTVIGGFARSLLQCDTIERDDRNKLDIIVKEVQRLEGLLAEIQDFTKPLRMERKELSLAPCLREVISLFGDSGAAAGVSFVLNIEGEPLISADPDRLRQVLLNVIKNAMEAILREGEISVRAWEEAEAVFVEIQDTGEGIPQERLEDIFEPFVTTKKGGSGLGLSLCRKIVEDHGGEIAIHSRTGHGARVCMSFPAVAR